MPGAEARGSNGMVWAGGARLGMGGPNGRGGWTPLRPLRGLQEPRVATREESGVLGFPSRRGLTPPGAWNATPRGTFAVASRVSSTVSPFRAEQGTSLETSWRARASSCQEVGTTWFFSSCGGILELRRGIQASCSTGPGKSSFHLNCELELGIALETLQGQIDLI